MQLNAEQVGWQCDGSEHDEAHVSHVRIRYQDLQVVDPVSGSRYEQPVFQTL